MEGTSYLSERGPGASRNEGVRTINLILNDVASAVVIVKTEICVRISSVAPEGAVRYGLVSDLDGDITVKFREESVSGYGSEEDVAPVVVAYVHVATVSRQENDKRVEFLFYNVDGEDLGKADLHLTCVDISLDVDADRDGIVEKNSPHKNSWKWGRDGYGAVLLVNSDCETANETEMRDTDDELVNGPLDLLDMGRMMLRTDGPEQLPEGYSMQLYVDDKFADYVGVFYLTADTEAMMKNKHVIGPRQRAAEVLYPGMGGEVEFAVEGLSFPDRYFEGFLHIHLALFKDDVPIYEDMVQFRVAPWIMTPNTLEAEIVYVCDTRDNKHFVEKLRGFVEGLSGIQLVVCGLDGNRGDRWMQDEIELGYTEVPQRQPMAVVLDSPRERGLCKFSQRQCLGPDFGYATRNTSRHKANSLDSFGNLEVSPPVKLNGKDFPLGRILIGNALTSSLKGRRMMRVVNRFLYAQKVQPVIELFSDWLNVGHIDEFMTFVPVPGSRQGFRLCLASPNKAYGILEKLQTDGHGDVVMFEGKRASRRSKQMKQETVSELLANQTLRAENKKFQAYIDFNRDILKRELGLEEGDIVDIPEIFINELDPKNETIEPQATSYFPDMVNMLVLGKNLAIPKPFGPVIDGECAFERYVRSALEPLGLSCYFLDDWYTYHLQGGEVHCGTNTKRKPFSVKWWDLDLPRMCQ
ncbi:PREDICTED: protein-arginine deiminase type-2-like isoform X2 [Priapulus caudatus]|nr:PREDICTED: protein-arginine deiminase type-2-like isoform X2 [Priapulus caudatus]